MQCIPHLRHGQKESGKGFGIDNKHVHHEEFDGIWNHDGESVKGIVILLLQLIKWDLILSGNQFCFEIGIIPL